MIEITKNLAIPEDELKFSATRSSGPGGQHVNKVNTRITLWFDVEESPGLNREQKNRILSRLKTRISKDNILRVISQRHRSQIANREAAIERFAELLKEALAVLPPRRKTKVSKNANQRRIDGKKHHSMIKKHRAKITHSED
ncbi:MAG: alternative ribosome rescue aminoacyl-tRNA hydrolase ArfB [Desulfobacteraceae bacterium]|jgi:ribosome-associated protein|nr:alternative ribosome rescue aminoacyl-tRNA hydrolase ArfB [Desulfobacteraceae bacterium]